MWQTVYSPPLVHHIPERNLIDYPIVSLVNKSVQFIIPLTALYLDNDEHLIIIDKLYESLLRGVIDTTLRSLSSPMRAEQNARISRLDYPPKILDSSKNISILKIAHEFSIFFDLSIAAAFSILWPNWARAVYREQLERFVSFAVTIMGVAPCDSKTETALKGIHAMEAFFHCLQLPTTLEELGIFPTNAEVNELLKKCLLQEEVAAEKDQTAIRLILICSQ